MALISVTKCQGTGNDFVLFDARGRPDAPLAEMAKILCPRRFGIGADGLLVLGEPGRPGADVTMRIFNPDGSEAAMCGNGIRCVARYLYDENPQNGELIVDTPAGLIQTAVVRWNGALGVRVTMGEPRPWGGADGRIDRRLLVDGQQVAAHAITIGNPNVVIFVEHDPLEVALDGIAATVAQWNVYDAEPNVEVVKTEGGELFMRVRERGAGETWACGTGACAAAAATILTRRATSPVKVSTQGGSVSVEWPGVGHPAVLTGDAQLVFRTQIDLAGT